MEPLVRAFLWRVSMVLGKSCCNGQVEGGERSYVRDEGLLCYGPFVVGFRWFFGRVAGKGRLMVARVEREVRSRGKKSTLRAFS